MTGPYCFSRSSWRCNCRRVRASTASSVSVFGGMLVVTVGSEPPPSKASQHHLRAMPPLKMPIRKSSSSDMAILPLVKPFVHEEVSHLHAHLAHVLPAANAESGEMRDLVAERAQEPGVHAFGFRSRTLQLVRIHPAVDRGHDLGEEQCLVRLVEVVDLELDERKREGRIDPVLRWRFVVVQIIPRLGDGGEGDDRVDGIDIALHPSEKALVAVLAPLDGIPLERGGGVHCKVFLIRPERKGRGILCNK